jgi:hypothetical protein
MRVAQFGHVPREVEQFVVLFPQFPVHSRQLIVLAVHVVVASLCATQLVAVGDHRDALRQE